MGAILNLRAHHGFREANRAHNRRFATAEFDVTHTVFSEQLPYRLGVADLPLESEAREDALRHAGAKIRVTWLPSESAQLSCWIPACCCLRAFSRRRLCPPARAAASARSTTGKRRGSGSVDHPPRYRFGRRDWLSRSASRTNADTMSSRCAWLIKRSSSRSSTASPARNLRRRKERPGP